MDIEFTVKLVISNAVDPEALREDYHNDPLEYIIWLTRQEGLLGCVDDDGEITSARIINQ